jgi:hypothetical protein
MPALPLHRTLYKLDGNSMTPKSRTEVFLYLASVCGLVWAVGWAFLAGGQAIEFIGTGAAFGIAVAVLGAPRLVGDTMTVPVEALDRFVSRLNIAASQIGYKPTGQVGGSSVLRPPVKAPSLLVP